MHRLWMFLWSFVLSVSLTGCGGEPPAVPAEIPGSQQTETAAPAATDDVQNTAVDWNSLSYSYTTQELPAEVDGHAIYGEIYIPEGAGEPMPAVIFSHGYGGTHSTGAPYAQALAEKGFVVYCYDFRGGSNSSRSDGSPLEMSVFTEKADLEAVLSMVQSLDDVDEERIFLMGTSQGGMVSAMAGAARPEEIRGMMLLYPAFCIPENARAQFGALENVPDQVSFFSWLTVGRRYVEDVWDYDVYGDVSSYEKDVLILHGDRDGIVDLSYSPKAMETYPAAELKVIEGAGHGFSGGGKCARVCPSASIRMEDGRAVHIPGNCQTCLARAHLCPQKAVQLTIPEKNPNARCRSPHITVSELIQANNQSQTNPF